MTYQQVYKAHYMRVVREKLLSAFIISLLAGLTLSAVVAIVTTFTEFYGLWTALGVLVGVTAVLTPILYFVKFRPDEKTVAQNIDRLGFDERAITMLELKGESSEIAEIQRADATKVLTAAAEKAGGKVAGKTSAKAKLQAVGLNTKTIIIASVIAVVAIASFIVSGLPKATVKDFFAPPPTFTVTVNAGDRGYLIGGDGNENKLSFDVEQGKGTPTVVVVPNSGRFTQTKTENGQKVEEVVEYRYYFAGWDDGWTDELSPASRYDGNVQGGYTVNAVYGEVQKVEEDSKDVGGGSGGNGPSGNGDFAPPPDGDGESPPNEGESPETGPGSPSGGSSGGETAPNGEVINNQTDYREIYQSYYDAAMEMLANGQEIPDALRKFIATYFGILL